MFLHERLNQRADDNESDANAKDGARSLQDAGAGFIAEVTHMGIIIHRRGGRKRDTFRDNALYSNRYVRPLV